MTIDPKINPVHCTSSDPTRYVLSGVSLQQDLAIATDGRVLFVALGSPDPVSPAPENVIISKKAATLLWKQGKKPKRPEASITAAATTIYTADGDSTSCRHIRGTYPPIDQVIPDPALYTHRVALNIDYLVKLSKAYGSKVLFLAFDSTSWDSVGACQSSPVIVSDNQTDTAVAFLMPCRFAARPENKALSSLITRKAAAEAAKEQAAAAAAEARTAAQEKTQAWLAANS
jgi:hypothetical protein